MSPILGAVIHEGPKEYEFVREEESEGVLIKSVFRRRIREVPRRGSFSPAFLVEDALIRREQFKKRSWGPFSWYERK